MLQKVLNILDISLNVLRNYIRWSKKLLSGLNSVEVSKFLDTSTKSSFPYMYINNFIQFYTILIIFFINIINKIKICIHNS